MNGFADVGLDEDNFGDAKGFNVRSFDAFPKTKATYLTRGRSGGAWTVLLICTCVWLTLSETIRWFTGTTSYTYNVEKGIGHELQMNLDIVVAMKCSDVRINVQDASGDRILAGDKLRREATSWALWSKNRGMHRLGAGMIDDGRRQLQGKEDVHDYLGAARKKKKFAKSPRIRGNPIDSCRIYGSIEGNKVQGDFHITARGHGYQEFGEHLDHKAFNFSHIINELSFGPYYPGLSNPLDNTIATTDAHFYKFQYYLSIVPTIYTENAAALSQAMLEARTSHPTDANPFVQSSQTVFTNQYAVTEQSHLVGEARVPGVFVKFDFEPILLTISEEWGGFLALIVRLVNVLSGVMVAGGWCYQISEWASETWLKRGRRSGTGLGVLHGRASSNEKVGLD
ncbi:putative COPII-coated vesicle protein [Lineolata rhizophorae]|uniref:Endoplasmic reticulum-Golgi intermediate compartment protein n=1 Tax=Lineolata rhizophorae TaxID=578093 RepID=A0A6A6PDZ8_9PEZI|nr:putative COPII-coated vesicle protein [Lineolata rhizophorae]